MGENTAQKNTTFLIIQQVTKGGVFLGSNKLKHNTTGMMELRFDEDNPDLTWISFSKNRRGPINQRLYFDLSLGGDVIYSGTVTTETSESPFETILREGPAKNPFGV